ncbi:MAG: hypothetical protein ACT4PT_02660 [Methanobacteriota archaeon]
MVEALVLSLLLVLLAAIAGPFAVPRRPGRGRRIALGLAGGLSSVALGLALLAFSTLAAGLLVGLGAAWAAARAYPSRRGWAAAWAFVPAILLSAIPAAIGESDATVLVYLWLAAPGVLLFAFGAVAARQLRWDPSPRSVVAAGALASFFAAFPLATVLPAYRQYFDVVAAPFLLAAIWGLAVLSRETDRRGEAPRDAAARSEGIGEYVARAPPLGSSVAMGASVVAAAASLLIVSAAWLVVGASPVWVFGAGAALVAGVLAGAERLRRAPFPWAAAPTAAVFASLGAAASIAFGVLAGDGDRGVLAALLVAATAATTVAGTALALSLAADEERRARVRAATHREALTGKRRAVLSALPAASVIERSGSVPGPQALSAFAEVLRTRGASVGLLLVRPPPGGTLWTLPPETYRWLRDENPTGPRVHVGIEEGDDLFLVPPVFPEEAEP